MVVIAGDVPSYFHGRHPHQEVNLHQDADQFEIYRPFCKRVYRVDRPADLPRIMERAFHLAQSGTARPGAGRRADGRLLGRPAGRTPSQQDAGADWRGRRIDAGDRRRASSTRWPTAERPVLYAGGGVLSARATAELAALAEALELPVAHTLMGKGCLREDHPLLLGQTGFWGTPIANEMCRSADLILAVGTRLAEANSSSWDPRFTFAIPPTRLIHIDVDAGRDRPQLPDRARRRRRREGWRSARWRRRRAGVTPPRPRHACATDRARPQGVRRELGPPVELGSVPDAPGAHPGRTAQGGARGRLHRHRRRLEQERRRRSSSRSRCPAPSSRRAAWRRWGSARRRCWA